MASWSPLANIDLGYTLVFLIVLLPAFLLMLGIIIAGGYWFKHLDAKWRAANGLTKGRKDPKQH